MDSRDSILSERLDHSCAMIEVLEHAAEGLDARAVVLEAEVREVEERLLRCEPDDDRAFELRDEWERRWRGLAGLASATRSQAQRKRNPQIPCGSPTHAGPQTA